MYSFTTHQSFIFRSRRNFRILMQLYLFFSRPFNKTSNFAKNCPCDSNEMFLVGAFSFKEKSPTITVASFFFRQTTELIAYVPLFTETDKFTQAKFHQCKLTAKGPPFVFYLFYVTYKTGRLQRVPPFNFFSALCEFFFRKFLVFQKSPPFGFFDILQQKVC